MYRQIPTLAAFTGAQAGSKATSVRPRHVCHWVAARSARADRRSNCSTCWIARGSRPYSELQRQGSWRSHDGSFASSRQQRPLRLLTLYQGWRPKRRRTVALSVVHEVFDGDNPRHVGAAANIDIRMIDQDLMPCHSDLWPAA